ncbi:hypothetical protein QAD02_013967 [Eretmocerus hayati]|uniref:Uncharacterized protein n=1 Tax=Eretmocerus hayati TaxID=131215 RepID=A0ACC2P8S7_9HYME|nr:hypothetical protein QAD02_013967 [Eretmocerus hayati]
MLRQLFDKMDILATDVTDLKTKFPSIDTLIKDAVHEEIAARDKILGAENASLKARFAKLKRSEELQDRRDRRNNIVIRGFTPSTEEYEKEISSWLEAKFDCEIKVAEATLINSQRGCELIIAKLASSESKRKLMTTKRTELAGTTISIKSDLTSAERATQREIYKIADAEREQGKQVRVIIKD